MTIVEINAVPYGSTGMIAKGITDICSNKHKAYFCYSWTKKRRKNVKNNEILIGSFFGKSLHMFFSKITGKELSFSYIDTLFFLKKLDKIKPDIIHLHIMHSWFLNIPLLFKYIKKNNIKVVWTFHDCWAFTGHCPHFEMANCFKWMNQCYKCPKYLEYPNSYFDNSKKMYKFKKKWFTYLDDVTIVTPSKWLKQYTENSFFKKYKIKVINNGIDLNKFKYKNSDFRKNINCDNKIILLGVALDWGERKGLDVFIKLSNDLPDNYQIVLVGTTKKIDKFLPKNIISIHKTSNQEELVKIYSAADLFINPTREDTFPTVNIEAISCGLPVITFNTGGSPEIIDKNCGIVVEKDNYTALKSAILKEANRKKKSFNSCIKRAKKYDMKDKFKEYVELFEDLNRKEQKL